MAAALLLLPAVDVRAEITLSGDITTGSPAVAATYNGTDNPWATSTLSVGNTANGSLTIDNGFQVNNTGTAYIGSTSAGIGAVTLSGVGSAWTNSGTLSVGYLGSGSLTILGGGTVYGNAAFIGSASGSIGTVTIGGGTGTATWTNSGALAVGNGGTGSLTIVGGGLVRSNGGTVAGPRGAVTVGGGTGTATWTNSGTLVVTSGFNGSSSLTVVGGGAVINTGATIGSGTFGIGAVTIGGGIGAATWTNTGTLFVGGANNGTGSLTIVGGGTVSNTSATIGNAQTSRGAVTVGGGTGVATWTNSGNLTVGSNATGSLTIVGGGTVSSNAGIVGFSTGSRATVTVGGGTGTATWNTVAALSVGFSSTAFGTVNITTGGLVITGQLNGGNANSSVNFDGGTLRITATDVATNSINLLAGGGTFDIPTAVTTFTINSNITGAGGLTKTGEATLVLGGTNNYAGPTYVTAGTLNLTGALTGGGAVNVSSGATFTAASLLAPGELTNNGNVYANTTIASGGTLAGSGTIHGTLTQNDGSTYAPGNSPGMQTTTGDASWGNITYAMQIADINGAQGVGYDSLDVVGKLTIVGDNIHVNVDSYPANSPVVNFTNGSPFDLILVSTTNGVENFVASNFHVDSSLFEMANNLAGGSFSIILSPDGDDLLLHYTAAVPEPTTLALFTITTAALGWRLRRKRRRSAQGET